MYGIEKSAKGWRRRRSRANRNYDCWEISRKLNFDFATNATLGTASKQTQTRRDAFYTVLEFFIQFKITLREVLNKYIVRSWLICRQVHCGRYMSRLLQISLANHQPISSNNKFHLISVRLYCIVNHFHDTLLHKHHTFMPW